jgi:hypothetical protein
MNLVGRQIDRVTDVSEELTASMFRDKQSQKRHVVTFHENCIVHFSFAGPTSLKRKLG